MNYTIGFERLGVDVGNLRRGRTTCPKCSADRRKRNERCRWVGLDSGNYKCHHCGWEGRVDSNEWINGKEQPETVKIRQYKTPTDDFKAANGIAMDYLKGRGITEEVIRRNQIGETDSQVVFRYYQGGKLVRAKFRWVNEKRFTQLPECRPILYKIDDILGGEYCIITEGEIDALSWGVAGITEAASLDNGAVGPGENPGGKFSCIVDAKPILDAKELIFIALDDDEKGRYTALKLAEFLGIGRCRRVEYPRGCKDANDVLMKHGPEELRRCITRAKGNNFELSELAKESPLLSKAMKTKFDYQQEFKETEAVLQVRTAGKRYDVGALGQIGVFSGHEKSGKSFVLECIAASAISGGQPKIGFSLELGDRKTIWFDTEQSAYFYHLNQMRLHHLAGVHGNTQFYDAYHLRSFSAPERVEVIESIIYNSGNVGAVIIDGFVDLLIDYNSLEETQILINKLMRWTDEKNILLMGVLHLNKGDGKLRGHQGSELKNKGDFQINVSKEEEVYSIKNPTSRYISFPGYTFTRGADGMPFVPEQEEEAPF